MMQRRALLARRCLFVLHARVQHDLAELPRAVRVERHRTFRVILVSRHDDSRFRAQMQKPQHVAAGERADQQLLGIVAFLLAAKDRSRRRRDRDGFSGGADFVPASVRAIITGPRAAVAGPLQVHGKLVPVMCHD